MNKSNIWMLIVALLFTYEVLEAQYFGRNKPRYQSFDFKVYETPNLEIYHYLDDNRILLEKLALEAEHWFLMHQEVLRDTIDEKNPLIFYNNHAHFQQTSTIGGLISVGTGGVTEALKNRVIMPIAMTNKQTRHVLGHELVHTYHYNMVLKSDSTNLNNLRNIPLWYIEGMAEYMSIGRTDPHTAMWMRDAVLNDDIPSIKDMADYSKYFPYRFGQAFLAFMTGVYGDDTMKPFYVETAKYGMEVASQTVFGIKLEELSKLWVENIKRGYAPWTEGKRERPVGRKLISSENAGLMNLSPVISPDGNHVIFLSEKSLFSLDLYLGDARTGEIIRKVASSIRESDIDAFNNMESAGTWSPDSREFAFVAFKRGKNILLIKEVHSGKTVKEIFIPGVESFTNPTWSPNGNDIVVTGMVNGQTDLFMYNLQTKKVTQLTDDVYSEIHPSFSPNGDELVFATDQLSYEGAKTNGNYTFNIAIMDMDNYSVEVKDFFFGADNMNPHIDYDNQLFFISDRNGIRNIYKYDISSNNLFQMTEFITGVSGITPFSPAISLGGRRGRLMYSHFYNREFSIYSTLSEQLEGKIVPGNEIDMAAAALPPGNPSRANMVMKNLQSFDTNLLASKSNNNVDVRYRPKFKLDYIGGGTGMGVNMGNSFGTNTALAGGVDMLFSDILGNNMIYAGLAMNGEIYDAGGQFLYFNRKNRLGWGIQASHIPFRTGFWGYGGLVTLQNSEGEPVVTEHYITELQRIYQDQFNVVFQLPFSMTRRFEFGGGFSLFYQRNERINNYYIPGTNFLLFQDRERLPAPDGLRMFTSNAAYVGDNSYFGIASPMMGHRYRISGDAYFGGLNFYTNIIDLRKYHFWKPVNISYRMIHVGRYGPDSDRLFRLFPIDPMLVRGFSRIGLDRFQGEHGYNIDQISGSKLLVGNFEIRFPFTGPPRFSLIPSRFLFTELALFADAGMAWSDFNDFSDENLLKPALLTSTGISLRINLFGALILEPYYAFPIINGQMQRGTFGFNLIPGW